jgi:hypothetical protein
MIRSQVEEVHEEVYLKDVNESKMGITLKKGLF